VSDQQTITSQSDDDWDVNQNEIQTPCQFEIYDKETKSMRICGQESKVLLDDSGYCDEHYVDAIMQLQSIDPAWKMPREIEKQIEVKSK